MKKLILVLGLLISAFAIGQERGDNLIVVTMNMDNEQNIMREINRQLVAGGWSVANANMDFLFIETTRRPMQRFNTHLVLNISVSNNLVNIRGNWYNQAVFGENPQTMDFVRSRNNVQYEMWELTMQLVHSLNPETIEYRKQ